MCLGYRLRQVCACVPLLWAICTEQKSSELIAGRIQGSRILACVVNQHLPATLNFQVDSGSHDRSSLSCFSLLGTIVEQDR